jgi:hypothetical protein
MRGVKSALWYTIIPVDIGETWNYYTEMQKAVIEVVPGNIAAPFSVRNAVEGCDIVFHLAALIAIPCYSKLSFCLC